MHEIRYSIRRILPNELPATTEADLLNLGIVPLGGDLYSCVDQYRRDPATLEWSVEGPESPGVIVSEGSLRQRHAQLPADVAPQVFRAQVIRSEDPAVSALMLAEETVAEVRAMLAEYVGDVDGAPLVDLSGPAPVLAEAQRLVDIPGNGIDRHVVPMAALAGGDLVEADGIIPHRWHGESPH